MCGRTPFLLAQVSGWTVAIRATAWLTSSRGARSETSMTPPHKKCFRMKGLSLDGMVSFALGMDCCAYTVIFLTKYLSCIAIHYILMGHFYYYYYYYYF